MNKEGTHQMYNISEEDIDFKEQVERGEYPVSEFNHEAHVRLAYLYLIDNSVDSATTLMRETLIKLLIKSGIDPMAKYHETITKSWIIAVHYCMQETIYTESADAFIKRHPSLLDANKMLNHYTAEVLFSDHARKEFIKPNLKPIC